jgi:hypothetical protein
MYGQGIDDRGISRPLPGAAAHGAAEVHGQEDGTTLDGLEGADHGLGLLLGERGAERLDLAGGAAGAEVLDRSRQVESHLDVSSSSLMCSAGGWDSQILRPFRIRKVCRPELTISPSCSLVM